MNVLHCITGLSGDGAQRMLLRLTQGLLARDISSSVISLGRETRVAERFQASGVPVYSLNLAASVAQAMRGVWRVKQLIDQLRPDWVQGWMYHANIISMGAVLASMRRPPLVWNIRRGLDDYSERSLKTRSVVRSNAIMSQLPQQIIYCSQESRVQHEGIGFHAERGQVLPNGFDTSTFCPCPDARERTRNRLGISTDGLVIGNVARFDVAKGHTYLLEAFADLSKEIKKARLVLIGRGVNDSNDELVAVLRRVGVADRVLLLGEQESIEAIYPAFDIYCSSSLNEGFPNAISEAMSCGVPCVVTDTGASRQLVEGVGIVVRSREALQLSNGLKELAALNTSARRELGEKARERIQRLYSLDAAVDRYADFYLKRLSARG
jgi:glycosyltransferase involved in cell wall biosynthesis